MIKRMIVMSAVVSMSSAMMILMARRNVMVYIWPRLPYSHESMNMIHTINSVPLINMLMGNIIC